MKTQILTAIGETGLQREVGLNACGIDDPILDTVVAGARMVGKSCRVPGVKRIFARIADDMQVMAAPVLAANPDGFAVRFDGLLKRRPRRSNCSKESTWTPWSEPASPRQCRRRWP